MKFGVRKLESWNPKTATSVWQSWVLTCRGFRWTVIFRLRTTESYSHHRNNWWWRNHAASFLRFDTIQARDGQTDRRTRCDRYYPR